MPFSRSSDANSARRLAALNLETREWKVVLPSGSQAAYVDTGHLVYEDGGALWAARFDVTTLTVMGDSMPVLEQVTFFGATANLAVSRRGTLAYAPSAGASAARSLVWLDRRGNESSIGVPQRAYYLPRLSPDGTRIAVSIHDGSRLGFWTWHFSEQRLTPMRSGAEELGAFSVWSPDSRYLFVGARDLFRHAADGAGDGEQLTSDVLPSDRASAALSRFHPTAPA